TFGSMVSQEAPAVVVQGTPTHPLGCLKSGLFGSALRVWVRQGTAVKSHQTTSSVGGGGNFVWPQQLPPPDPIAPTAKTINASGGRTTRFSDLQNVFTRTSRPELDGRVT